MRTASKNEILILLGNNALAFAAFCLSEQGAAFKFLFDNATNFDLDDAFITEMVTTLSSYNIIDQECVNRINSFKTVAQSEDGAPIKPSGERTYQLPPPGTVKTVDEYCAWVVEFCEFTDQRVLNIPLVGQFSLVGTCNHPDAREVL